MSWMQTRGGERFDLLAPDPALIEFGDIANALAKLCRYTGHCRRFYSVAQHSVIVAGLLPPELRLQGLLHDATEAYVGDVARPLKLLLPDYQAIERGVWLAIAERFGLPAELNPAVKRADNLALMAERASLMFPSRHAWDPELEAMADEARALVGPVVPMPPDEALMAFRAAGREILPGVVA